MNRLTHFFLSFFSFSSITLLDGFTPPSLGMAIRIPSSPGAGSPAPPPLSQRYQQRITAERAYFKFKTWCKNPLTLTPPVFLAPILSLTGIRKLRKSLPFFGVDLVGLQKPILRNVTDRIPFGIFYS